MKPALLYILLSCVIGCGTLQPPSAPFQRVAEPVDAGIELTAIEGRPAGLVLRIRVDAPDAERIELYRVQGSDNAALLQAFELESDVRSTFVSGVEIVDSTIKPGEFQYQLVARSGGETVGFSEAVDVHWRQPPPQPSDVNAVSPYGDVVELTWTASVDVPVVIFRRDVLEEGQGFVRVAEVRGGVSRWVDRDVSPGGVWSYRLAFAHEHVSGLLQYGKATEELYATTPEAQ